MTNLTITVDAQTLKRARLRALKEDTSVNALLRDYLEEYAGVKQERQTRREAWRDIQGLAKESGMGSGGKGLPKRGELYDREALGDRTSR